MFSIYGAGSAGTNYKLFGSLSIGADTTGTISGTSAPGRLIFNVTPDGSLTPVAALTIKNDGSATFGNAAGWRTGLGAASLAANTFTGLQTFAAGADIASATTVGLTAATGNLVRITGTTATTGVTINNGQVVLCYPTGAWPLTYHATNMPIKGGVSYTCAAGDTVIFSKDGNGTLHVDIFKADGTALVVTAAGLTIGTPVASTSGTSIDFTGLPAGTKRVTINLAGVSTNGSSDLLFQIGDSGGIEATGYLGASSRISAATPATANYTTGFGLNNGAATNIVHGSLTLLLLDAANNTWAATGVFATSNGNVTVLPLDRSPFRQSWIEFVLPLLAGRTPLMPVKLTLPTSENHEN